MRDDGEYGMYLCQDRQSELLQFGHGRLGLTGSENLIEFLFDLGHSLLGVLGESAVDLEHTHSHTQWRKKT